MQRTRARDVAELEMHPGQQACLQQEVVLVTEAAEELESRFEESSCALVVALVGEDIAEKLCRDGGPPGVVEGAMQRERFFSSQLRGCPVTCLEREHSRAVQRLATRE